MLCLGLVLFLAPREGRGGESVRYALRRGSVIARICRRCPVPAARPEALHGFFTMTPLPIVDGRHIEALTDVEWRSRSYGLAGTGFVQFAGGAPREGVVFAEINGERVRLHATRSESRPDGGLLAVFATPHRGQGYLIVMAAERLPAVGSDADGDNIGDEADNCVAEPNPEQGDSDLDGVGDECDSCPDTEPPERVNGQGCSLDQTCPCLGPDGGGEWPAGGYKRCVGSALRALRHQGAITRREMLRLLRRALRSGCGRTILALR